MVQFSTDQAFHYEIIRLLGLASYGGADVGEVLASADEITPGDFESFYTAFNKRGDHIVSQIEQMRNPISIRDASFRAATYFRLADQYIHGNWDDPRILELWDKQTKCFDRANSLLPIPGERRTLPATTAAGVNFNIHIIFFAASKDTSVKRPTILMGGGLDGAMEELFHVHGIAALERGFNVVCFDGPGQALTRRSQGLGYILEWERVVSPILDHLETLPNVDTSKTGLIGYSLNALLCTRAAAFDHRLAALFCIDAIYDINLSPVVIKLQQFLHYRFPNGDADVTDASLQALYTDRAVPTQLRWGISHGTWATNVKSPFEFAEIYSRFTLAGKDGSDSSSIVKNIRCPVLVCDAEQDHFFVGQGPKLMAELGDDIATYKLFTKDDAAEQHCHLGAARYCNQAIYDWFEEKVL